MPNESSNPDKSIYAGIVYLCLEDEEVKVLLVHHKQVNCEDGRHFKSYWCNAGGGVEKDEKLDNAWLRELEEETSQRLTANQLESPTEFKIYKHDESGTVTHVKDFILIMRSGVPANLASTDPDIDDIQLFSIHDLPNPDNNERRDKIARDHFRAIQALLIKLQESLPLSQKKLVDTLVDSLESQKEKLHY